ncbi:tetratricopeptide repeat-containing sensor histidine kinase [Bacteroides thetaiotaomicron]|jgi:signal transduction histidine kinase|uniref:tetratricopeptide repeat-containing sensor histidine kinase n=1 Tax=Bacteroides thetaiotaomicron TaxID=818 RepID=UPI001C038874|nr:HAMP domain-containing sensor histidine kinase [Bacteroides thetaiotaomicron]MBT9900610.1 sensor histidine kinase [Bacteroides thetaiotaomicron]MDC2012927.1 ATP-binding protein [Bacteroides thetaiotaomicron]MDC2017465.1 ATP-binding protein [Bacteroides thetaiotaomicron]MDC2035423.1 ATP-binding protein [Bacteroides thetaiotaomicron]MDC2039746.1 ATP-binding protein [Bacteroides thetaiotaomicron]
MKRNIYILFAISLLIRMLPLHSANSDTEHLSTLKRLIDSNIAYDSLAPMDSVIVWGQQISPILEKDNKMELSFSIRQLVVYLYSLRGDIGNAIDEAREMYEKAETIKYDFGMALSSAAIGDAYFCSNMPEEAIASYKEAIRHPAASPENNYYKEMTILKLIQTLILKERTQEAEKYRKMLSESKSIHSNQTLQFLTLATDVSYYIQKNELPNAHNCLLQAEQIYLSDKQPYYSTTYNYMQGRYNAAIGKHTLALQYYDNILTDIRQKMQSIIYLQIAYIKANLLIEMDHKKEAARLYEEISMITDSVIAPSYAHRINNLRASYEENRMKVENKAEFNRIFLGGIVIGIIVLGVMIYLVIHIVKQNKKIAESKIRMEQSRLNAENAMQSKSLFLSNMSHEIRTPLSALSGFSSLLTEQALDEETRRQCGDIIQQNSDLLLKLINDVIDLSNLEIGNMKFNFNYCDAIAICNNVIDTVNKVKQTQAELRFNTSLPSLKLYTDDSRLQQLLINLLINATKFTPQGNITLEVQQESEDFALFSVTDTGCGIPLEKQSSIFNRFEKLNEGAQGTGLGLSICQLIIERIGGKIWIDPNYTTGCRFYFTHPINPTKQGKEAQS